MTDDAPGSADTDPTPAPPAAPATEGSSTRLELFAAIILGIAATLTAFSAYKAALLDGDALQGYTKSTRILSDSNAFYAQANQTYALDQQLFVQYASATKSGDQELADYLQSDVMRPELSKAVDWWIATDGARTPFDDEDANPYVIAENDEAQKLEAQASKVFATAADADDNGDEFELATVLLAITLFFGGIATLFRRRPAAITLLVVAVGTLVAGGVGVATALGG